jgi:hypothetical protein
MRLARERDAEAAHLDQTRSAREGDAAHADRDVVGPGVAMPPWRTRRGGR